MSECPWCNGSGYVARVDNIGYERHVTMVVCPDMGGVHRQEQAARLACVSGMLPEELVLMLDDVAARGDGTGKMIALARQFVADPFGMLTLWGGYGNGKTLILQAIVNELREHYHWAGAYVRLSDLLGYIRAGNEKDAAEDARERYERFKRLAVLAIDECDGPRMTEYAEEFRRTFFDDRYRLAIYRKAHTILAMNCDPAILPGDIWDRLRDGRFVVFHNADASARPAMRR